ncbi:MAG: hypothetical protein IBX55_12050 [Methyloprofundus sp.]|nr:hypothetical protein [Methyloprofundus sp.]
MFKSYKEVCRFYQDHASQIKLVESTLSSRLGISNVRVIAKHDGVFAIGYDNDDEKIMTLPLTIRDDGRLRVCRA